MDILALFGSTNPEEKIESSPYHFDNFCFDCKLGGTLDCCSQCPKTYHALCLKKQKYQNLPLQQEFEKEGWRCPCCTLESICPVCQKQVLDNRQDKAKFMCSVCYRRVHTQCYPYYSEFSQMGQQMKDGVMVCIECFRLAGIHYIKQRKLLQSTTYFLVKPFMSSNIHTTWISMKQYQQLSDRVKNNQTPRKTVKYDQQFFGNTNIDKILICKLPLKQPFDLQKREVSLNFGSNLKFLVKWEGLNISKATWEDQFALKCSGKLQNYVSNYFYWKWINEGLTSEQDGLNKLLSLYPITLTQEISHHYIENLIKLEYGYHKIFEGSQKLLLCLLRQFHTFPVISQKDKPFFLNYKKVWRTLLVTDKPEYWYKIMRSFLPFLRIVLVENQQKNILTQLDCEILTNTNKPMFNILIVENESIQNKRLNGISYDMVILDKDLKDRKRFWKKHTNSLKLVLYSKEINIIHRIPKSYELSEPQILEQFSSERFRALEQEKKNSMNMELQIAAVSNEIEEGEIVEQTLTQQINLENKNIEQEMFANPTYQHVQNEVGLVPTQLLPCSEHKPFKIIKVQPLNKLQRIHFMRFVLQFGLQFESYSDLYKRLTLYEPEKNIFTNSEVLSQSTKYHVKDFVEHLNQNKHSQYLFDQWKCEDIIRRIACLSTIRKAYNHYYLQPWKLSIVESFPFANRGKQTLYSQSWTFQDDIRLMHLILEHGFSNWEAICQNFCKNYRNKNSSPEGYEYLRVAIWPTLPKNRNWKLMVLMCVKVRGNMLLNNQQFQQLK